MSDRKPELSELALVLNTLSWSEVKAMAVQLRMEFSRLQHIEQQNTAVTDRLLSAMDMWLNSDANATWARIIKALNDTDRTVLAKEIEQKYCQPVNVPHATTRACSLPPHIHTSDSTEVSSQPIPHRLSSPSQQTSSQLFTGPHICPSSEYSHPTSPQSVSVATPDGGTPISQSKQSPSQPLSSSTQQPRKQKHRNSPTLLLPPSPFPLPQSSPQPPQLSTTEPHKLPGWQPKVVTTKEKIRRIREEASELEIQFVSVVGQAEFCFSIRESKCETFRLEFRTTLVNLPISKRFENLKFLEDKCEEIESASSVSKIFRLLQPYWNYTDYALLHHLINIFGDEDRKKMMKRYISSLETYEKRTTIQDYEDAMGKRKEVPQGFFEAVFTSQEIKDPSEYTLYDVRQFAESLAQESSLEPYVLMIKKACIGSLVITIALPPPALDLLQQALYKEFLDTLKIVSVRIQNLQFNITFCRRCLKVTTIMHIHIHIHVLYMYVHRMSLIMSCSGISDARPTYTYIRIHVNSLLQLTLNLLSYRTDSLS